jgi:Tfp pilus assembly protein PilP
MSDDACGQTKALVLDPDGYVHSAIRGVRMGKNKGVLVKIEKTGIVVSEIVFSEIDDDWREKFVFLPAKDFDEDPQDR